MFPNLNILGFFVNKAKQLLCQTTHEMKITVARIFCAGKSNNYGQDGGVFVCSGARIGMNAARCRVKRAVILQEYAPLILHNCDKGGLAVLPLGLTADAATLRPDNVESLIYGLWVRLDSNPIVPYTGLPKAD